MGFCERQIAQITGSRVSSISGKIRRIAAKNSDFASSIREGCYFDRNGRKRREYVLSAAGLRMFAETVQDITKRKMLMDMASGAD